MQAGGTMLARLDREMAPAHVEVEQEWHQLLRDRSTTRDDYRRQLIATYGFESPVESACSHTPGLAHAIDLRGRRRAGLIVQDLLALGMAAEDIAGLPCHARARFADPAEALAWMYVVERPALIHDELRDALARRFAAQRLSRATAYLAAYEGTASKRWAELGIALDRVCVSDAMCRRVIDAAHAALCARRDWRLGSEPLRSVG